MIIIATRNASVPASSETIGVELFFIAFAKASNSSSIALLPGTSGLSK